jgi:hypothetical protein
VGDSWRFVAGSGLTWCQRGCWHSTLGIGRGMLTISGGSYGSGGLMPERPGARSILTRLPSAPGSSGSGSRWKRSIPAVPADIAEERKMIMSDLRRVNVATLEPRSLGSRGAMVELARFLSAER